MRLRSSSTWNSPALGAGVRAAITSHARILMNHAVHSDAPQRRALSRRLGPSAMHSANAIRADAGSFDRDSSPSVFADQVLPHPVGARKRVGGHLVGDRRLELGHERELLLARHLRRDFG